MSRLTRMTGTRVDGMGATRTPKPVPSIGENQIGAPRKNPNPIPMADPIGKSGASTSRLSKKAQFLANMAKGRARKGMK